MNRRDVIKASALLAASAWAPAGFAQGAAQDHSARIRELIGKMTLAEKLGQMTQIPGGRQKALNSKLDAAMLDRVRRGEMGSFLHVAGAAELRELQRVAVEESRLKIPLLFAMDVIHGFRTILPVPLALAATWDVEAAEAAARLAAEEAWAAGLHWTFTPMVDIARDPRWGRVVEGAGEDPYLGSRMAEAQIRGFQGADLAHGKHVLACAKHFAGYGAAEGGRDYDGAELSERTLHEVYLPPFHAAMRAGSATMMTAFNSVGGVPMTANAELVRGELRGRWGYDGLIVSDWNAIVELINHGVAATPAEAAALALRAGVDMDMASGTYAAHLGEAVAAEPGLVKLVDEAVRRILTAKARLGLFDRPLEVGSTGDYSPDRRTARQLATRAIVLLRNEGELLPLRPGPKTVLIGALAADASSTLGSWRAQGRAADSVTLKAALDAARMIDAYADGADIAQAVALARGADRVILAIGEDYDLSGEARSRSDLGLPGNQAALVEALKAVGKPIIVVLMSGRPLALEKVLAGVPAVLATWFLGTESGNAIRDVLTGAASPGGKLPMGFPRTTGQVPMSYAHAPTGRPANPDLAVDSARYRDVDIGALFPFGHGLSYSRFDYGQLSVEGMRLSVPVTNIGGAPADEVVQLYVRDPVASVARPVQELRGFVRVALKPGETRRVTFELVPEQFGFWQDGKWIVEPGEIQVMVGSSSADIRQARKLIVARWSEGALPAASIATRTSVE
jgi:beta-glucosidase